MRIERFTTPASGLLIIPKNGAPYRLDGKPLTDADYKLIAGRDPLKEELDAIRREPGYEE